MDIGTAKLSVAERARFHHQLDVDVTETATVARYQQEAAADVERISAAGVLPIIVGGSMMYIQSLLDEWAFPPPTRLSGPSGSSGWPRSGPPRCTGACPRRPGGGRFDPGHRRQRIVRALEVVELTGKPFAASAPTIGAPRWDTASSDWIGRRRSRRSAAAAHRQDVRRRPRRRGVRSLDRDLRDGVTASRALGYAQVIDDLDGGDDLAAREPTFIGTRRYVRRQRSWFRRDHRITWLDGAGGDNVEETLRAWRHVS